MFNGKSTLKVIAGLAFLSIASIGQAMTDEEMEILFEQGIEQSEFGDLNEAVSIFETILNERPTLHRVRLELALANFRALNYAAAKQLAEKVLSDPTTPEGVKRTITAFLDEVDAQGRPHTWDTYASLGYIYDDNINVGPGTDTIDVAGGTITLGAGSTPISSTGVQFNGGVSHRYLVPKTFTIAGDRAAMAWQSRVSYFRNQYLQDENFNLGVLTFSSGPVLLASRKWNFKLNGQVDHISLGNDSLAWYAGVTPSFTWIHKGRTSITASFQAQNRDFHSDDERDALYLSTGLSVGHRFKLDYNPTLNVGLRIFTENADAARRSNEGISFNTGLNFQPTNQTNIFFSFNWNKRNYDGPEPVFGVVRDETQRRIIMGLSHRLEVSNFMNDSLLNLSYSHTNNHSNVSTFDYSRKQVVLSLSRSF